MTSLILLVYAGASQTHRHGKYRDVVQCGLQFLLDTAQVDEEPAPRGLSFGDHEHATRRQALATLAICRHYAMTNDDRLHVAAQLVVNELCERAHWPSEQSTTDKKLERREAAFWQMAALKESHLAYLEVSRDCISATVDWLSDHAHSTSQPSHVTGLVSEEATDRTGFRSEHLLLSVGNYQSQSLLEQYSLAQALHDYRDVLSPLALRRLQEDVRTKLRPDTDRAETALRILILQTRPPRFLQSEVEDDDFPL
ncbi:hypothetical protein NA78x_000818 [Anatilimnocola sp. NA78]|uniref:hypothetical protein n=1 Tax=Anatilimnocola sp. NA78 TaxID=3415683 RepID=UPI003CE58E15